jgi:two-component system, NarL family, sensor histidine kinase DevS
MNDVLAQLKEIATAVTQAAHAGDLEDVLESIASVSQELTKSRYAALGVPDGKGGLRYFKTAGMTPEDARQIGHLPRGEGLLGTIMNEHETLRIERIQDDPRSVGFCDGHPVMTSLLGVPILAGSRLFGMLYLCDRLDGLPFDEQDQWLIETIAGYAGLAIAGSQLSEQQSLLALLEERERISMDLHDGVIQSLYAIGMHLELARTGKAIRPADLDRPIADLNLVIEDIRRYILNLKTRDQPHKTIYGSLQDLIARINVSSDTNVSLDAPDDYPPFSPGVFEGICQIVNEAISNVVRHAAARHLDVTAREQEGFFEITIADNGHGFELDQAMRADGLGLRNIQKRALLYGGRITIDTGIGKGTRITLTIPT